MENGTTKAFYLSVGGANAITNFVIRALDHVGVPVPEASTSKIEMINGAPGLLRLRVEARDKKEDWRVRFDSFFANWAESIKNVPPVRDDVAALDKHVNLVLLARECVEIANGYIRRDLWDDSLVREHITSGKAIRFPGVLRKILVRRIREAAPQHLLGLSRERVNRMFKANRARIGFLSDPFNPRAVTPRSLIEAVVERIGETDVEGIQDDLDRYLQACGRGPESIVDLGDTDFFDQVADDPLQTDSLGAWIEGRSTATYSDELARIVRGGIRPTAELPELQVIEALLKECLKRLKELDPEAHAAVRRFMDTQEPDPDDPRGVVFAEGRRQLFWCIHKKVR
jgi:hypothetical protein